MIVTVLDDYQNVALSSADWSEVQTRFTVQALTEHIFDENELVRALSKSDVIVTMRERTALPARVLEQLPTLRLIATAGMQNAAIDIRSAKARGVVISGTESQHGPVVELTIGMMIALMRNFVAEDRAMRAGGWQHTIGPSLAGHTLGVVGLGHIGAPVAELGRAFGMDVIAWSPNLTQERAERHGVRAVSKSQLFSESDVVTIHMPLSDASRGMVGAAELQRMKPTAYLINTSRGPIVDEIALVSALAERRLAGAGLDVYDVEPLPIDHPLRTLPNTLLLPHLGYVTTNGYRARFGQIVENILAWSKGAPIRVL